MKINFSPIMSKGKSLLLAYDQGLEHGPTDFNDKNADPDYILDIAEKGKYNGMILQKGIAEKYYHHKVPLIVKLNGKTSLVKGDPISPQLCTVKEAVKLGAKAVGYTIYVGSSHERKIFQEFENIQKEAHQYGLPVIAWMYPRGKVIKNDLKRDILAYSARIGLELGADFLKMKYNHNIQDFKWTVKNAGKAKLLVAGGHKSKEKDLLKDVHDVMNNGATGIAIGRNIWQHDSPLKITKALRKVVFDNATVSQAMKELK